MAETPPRKPVVELSTEAHAALLRVARTVEHVHGSRHDPSSLCTVCVALLTLDRAYPGWRKLL